MRRTTRLTTHKHTASHLTRERTGIEFDYHDYDERGDVLFLHVEEPKEGLQRHLRLPRGTPSNTTSVGPSSG